MDATSLGAMSPEEQAAMWQALSSSGSWRGEFLNRRKGGSRYWESAAITAIKNASGDSTHYLKLAEDITERRAMMTEVRRYANIAQQMDTGLHVYRLENLDDESRHHVDLEAFEEEPLP